MKLQHLAIIFIIIILPISLVIGEYIQAQIDTIYIQTGYSKRLQDATYDAMKAFQLNTINNKYSSISDSKIRDIEASINTFYNSLGTAMGASGYDKDTLKEYIPAIVYTMYDGYYIYGKYFNYQLGTNGEYQYGLKPYIYYSCRYNAGSKDFIVNYTLDNSITIYGKVNDTEGYVTKSGYLIDYNLLGNEEEWVTYKRGTVTINYPTKVKYGDIYIEKEILTEQLITVNDEGEASKPTNYEYTEYKNQKIYKENGQNKYFYYKNNKKEEVSDEGKLLKDSDVTELRYAETMTIDGHLYNNSAVEYYAKAKEFSKWVEDNIGNIKQSDAIDSNGKKITDFAVNIGDEKIFNFKDNDPLAEGSTFNEHRMSVIRKSIETNLISAIANYNAGSAGTYEFQMPIFTESDWEKLLNNISIAVFMQGMPIKAKFFNNYCIITNNKNEEVVTNESIYMLTNENGNIIAHLPGCKELVNNQDKIIGVAGTIKEENCKAAGYNIIDFERQTLVGDYIIKKDDGTVEMPENREIHYYPQGYQKCYNCIVNASVNYYTNDIIKGKLKQYDKNTDEYKEINTDITILRTKYLTVLARERYNLYRTNSQFNW